MSMAHNLAHNFYCISIPNTMVKLVKSCLKPCHSQVYGVYGSVGDGNPNPRWQWFSGGKSSLMEDLEMNYPTYGSKDQKKAGFQVKSFLWTTDTENLSSVSQAVLILAREW